jgi:hypothetical protein
MTEVGPEYAFPPPWLNDSYRFREPTLIGATGNGGYAPFPVFLISFPAEPLPLALNIVSKLLRFVAETMLFVWRADGEVSGAKA